MGAPTIDGHTPKAFLQGTHRTVPPAATLARLLPLLKEYAITRLANITGLDDLGIPVVMAIRPNARSLSVAQGKGADLTAAKVSALMESIEQHHAERHRLDVRWASFDELAASEPVVDPDRLPQVGRGYDRRAKILWTRATSLHDRAQIWVPHELVHLDFTLPLPPGSGCFLGGSNGLASGNHPLEALVHALTEVIERDALTLLYGSPPEVQQQRQVDAATVDDDLCRSLLGRYERAGVAVGIWNATSDVGVPTFLCDVIDRETNAFRPLGSARGTGCHPDAAVALARALTEAAQSRLTRIAGSRDDLQNEHVAHHRSDEKIAVDRARILRAAASGARFERTSTAFATFEQEVAHLCARLAAVGAGPALVVDLSPGERPFHVLRVIVPGLEGPADNPAYRPGRRARAVAAGSAS